jgi:geranylgeranyl pyrophosphate synthase
MPVKSPGLVAPPLPRIVRQEPDDALRHFAAPVAQDLDRVAERIREILGELERSEIVPVGSDELISAPVLHLFLRKGKLLRPMLVLLCARATGRPGAQSRALVRAAAAVEILHTASLAHDDIVDSSESRRGLPSLHAAYGSAAAVLVGDLFYARFFQEISGLPETTLLVRHDLLDTFLAVTARMCQGEILEEGIRSAGREATREEYLGITEAKTASLVSACCRAGALIGGASSEAVAALSNYGRDLGLLFQMADDVSDGDAACPSEIFLREKARAATEAALSSLHGIGAGPAAMKLRELAGFLLAHVMTGAVP